MRHKVESTRLNRKPSHLKAMTKNMVVSLILFESIKSTKPKAKIAAKLAERLISVAKRKIANNNKTNAIRYLSKYLFTERGGNGFESEKASRKLIDVLLKKYSDRNSGFTRIVKIGNRGGDNAPVVYLQLV